MEIRDVLPVLVLSALYLAAYRWPIVGLVAGWVLLAMGLIALWAGDNDGKGEG